MYKSLLALLLLLSALHAQVRLELLAPPGQAFAADACWQLRLESHFSQPQRVYFAAELSDGQGEPAWVGRSASFSMRPGEQGFEQGSLPTISQQQRDSALTPGSYTLCVKVMTEDNEQELIRQCAPRQVRDGYTAEAKEPEGPFSFSGTARLTTQYSNQQNPYTTAPPSFARLEASPQLTIMGLPFSSRLFFSTEQRALRYDINTANIQFDVATFQRKLQQEVLNKLKEKGGELIKEKLDEIREAAYQKAIQKLGPEARALNSPDIIGRFQELEKLDRIDALLTLPVFDQLKKDWKQYENLPQEKLDHIQDSLKRMSNREYAKFLRLREQASEYERLLDKREGLLQLKNEMRGILAMKERLEEAEKLRTMSYESLLNDPKVLKRVGALEKAQKLLSQVRRFGVGTVFPYHSAFTLDGVSVKGVDVEVAPSGFYAGVTLGKIQQTAFVFDTLGELAPRSIFAARVGYGEPEGNHLHLHMLNASEADNEAFAARRNQVLGLSGQYRLFGDRVRIEGEWAHSRLRNDPSQVVKDSITWEDRLRQSTDVQGDAWQLRAEFRPTQKTQIRARYAWVAPEFYSMGVPLLITDRERYEFRGEQRLLDGKISLSAFYRKDADNLVPYKFTQTTATSAGFDLEFRPKQLPYIRVSYAPFFQQNDRSDSLAQNRSVSVLTATSGYLFNIGKITGNSTLIYSQQLGAGNDTASAFTSNLISFNQSLNLDRYSFTFTGSWLHHDYSVDFNRTLSLDASVNAVLFKKWNLGLGGVWMDEKEVLERKGFYLNSSYPITPKIHFDLLMQRHALNDFEDRFQQDTEYLVRAGVRFSW